MKSLTAISAAIAALSVAACATNPPPAPGSGAPGYSGGPGYAGDQYGYPDRGDPRYANRGYDDGYYGNDRYDDRRHDVYNQRYHGQRYWDDRARRHYYIDARTGATIWVNGELRTH